MSALLSFVMALFITTATMPLVIRYAGWLGLMDDPAAGRKVHVHAIPRSGGLAIVLGVFTAAIWWVPKEHTYLPLALTVMLVAIAGYLDDRFDLSALQKFLGQCVASTLFVVAYGGFPQLPFFGLDAAPAWLCMTWTLVFLLGVTNAVNLSDGLDGLAAGNSLLTIGLLGVLAMLSARYDYVLLALTLGGGLVGFLRFNTHPARLFMGDSGSQFVGFAAAALTVLILQEESTPVSPLLPLLIFGLPILDTLTVMFVRLAGGRPLFTADRSHLHHQLLSLGFRHYEVVALMYALQAAIVLLAFVMRAESDHSLLLVYLSFCSVVLGGIFLAKSAGWQAHARTDLEPGAERRNRWLRKFTWYHKHCAKVLSVAVAVLLVAAALENPLQSELLRGIAIVTATLFALALFWQRGQSVVISRVITFVAVAFAVHGFVVSAELRPALNIAVDVGIALLAVMVVLAIRLTRSSLFHLDTQDYLTFFLLAAILFLPLEQLEKPEGGRVLLHAGVLLYACEFVVSKGNWSRRLLGWTGVVSLVVLGLSF